MSPSLPTLHMICGKNGAGKSTLAHSLSQAPTTVRLAEDEWLGPLFGEQMTKPADYLTYSAKLRSVMGPHVLGLLKAGVTVVLDFPANTLDQRAWMKGLVDQTEASHELHVIVASDELCLARLHARNSSGTHPFHVSDAQFHQITKHFLPPTPEEGFHLV